MTKRHKDFVLALSGGFAFFAIVHIARYGIELFSGAVANWPAGTILRR